MTERKTQMVDIKYIGKTLTVAGLVEALSAMPQHLGVVTQGCDCGAVAMRVVLEEDRVYIRRFDPYIEEDEDR